MGWCSATTIFDAVCDAVLSDKPVDKKAIISAIAGALEDGDWDCHMDSDYWKHPIVHEVMKEMHPDWFNDEER